MDSSHGVKTSICFNVFVFVVAALNDEKCNFDDCALVSKLPDWNIKTEFDVLLLQRNKPTVKILKYPGKSATSDGHVLESSEISDQRALWVSSQSRNMTARPKDGFANGTLNRQDASLIANGMVILSASHDFSNGLPHYGKWSIVVSLSFVVAHELLVSGKQIQPLAWSLGRPIPDIAFWFLWFLFSVMNNAMCNLVTPTALDLASALGVGAVGSGYLVSSVNTFVFGSALLSTWVMSPWRLQYVRLVVIVCMVFATMSMFSYAWILEMCTSTAGTEEFWSLCMLRMLMGLSATAVQCMLYCIVIRATPQSGKTGLSICTNAFKNLGNGVGPLLGSLIINTFVGDTSIFLPCADTMYVCTAIFGVTTLMVCCIVPLNESMLTSICRSNHSTPEPEDSTNHIEVPNDSANPVQEESPELLAESSRQTIMQLTILNCGMRGFVVASVESTTSMILEEEFHWRVSDIGFAIAVVFIGTAALSVLIMGVRMLKLVSDTSLMIALALMSNMFSFMFSSFVTNSPLALLVAGLGVYSAAYSASSILCGFAARAAINDSQWYTNETFQSADIAAVAIARLVAGPASRLIFEKFGRNGYAGVILFVTLCSSMLTLNVKWVLSGGSSSNLSCKGCDSIDAHKDSTEI